MTIPKLFDTSTNFYQSTTILRFYSCILLCTTAVLPRTTRKVLQCYLILRTRVPLFTLSRRNYSNFHLYSKVQFQYYLELQNIAPFTCYPCQLCSTAARKTRTFCTTQNYSNAARKHEALLQYRHILHSESKVGLPQSFCVWLQSIIPRQSGTAVLRCTTKYCSGTTPYCTVICQLFCLLHTNLCDPVLSCFTTLKLKDSLKNTKYHINMTPFWTTPSTTFYYHNILLQYCSSATPTARWPQKSVVLQYYSVLQNTIQSHLQPFSITLYNKTQLQYQYVLQNTRAILSWLHHKRIEGSIWVVLWNTWLEYLASTRKYSSIVLCCTFKSLFKDHVDHKVFIQKSFVPILFCNSGSARWYLQMQQSWTNSGHENKSIDLCPRHSWKF